MKAIVRDTYGHPMSWNSGTSTSPSSPTMRYWFVCTQLVWVGTSGTS